MTSWPEVSNDPLVCQVQKESNIVKRAEEKKHRGQLLEAVRRDDLQVVLRARLEVAGPDSLLRKSMKLGLGRLERRMHLFRN